MSMHPTIAAALADQRRQDMIARAETQRIARAARAARPSPARPVRIIQNLIAAALRPVTRLLRLKTPAPAGAGSQS
jgi:hypothetical protein